MCAAALRGGGDLTRYPAPTMCPDTIIRRFAGTFVLLSLALGTWVSPYWYLFTAFVGFNLLQSSFTSFCPLERILGRLGLAGCASGPPHAKSMHERAQ